MLFTRRFWAGLEDGSVTIAFRRWKRPTVKAGGRQRVPVGVLRIDAVDEVAEDDITEDDARRAGYRDRAELLAELPGAEPRSEQARLYRIAFSYDGPDERVALQADDDLDEQQLRALHARLDRLDRASARGPWVDATLRIIGERPEVVSTELAEELGVERLPFKRDVRKLKALGLTVSCEVGYRLSPRGRVVLDHRRPAG